MTRRITATRTGPAAPAGVIGVTPAGAAGPVLAPQKFLDRETLWDNRDRDW